MGDATNLPQVVWEYINPVTEDGIKSYIIDQYPMYNSVFCAYRYTTDHPALKGRTLTKGSTITGKTPQYLKPGDLLAAVEDGTAPTDFELSQNYPNPFNPETSIKFRVSSSEFVSLKVFDVLGREVGTLVNEVRQPGVYSVRWDASSFPSGVYFYTLSAGKSVITRKMVLAK